MAGARADRTSDGAEAAPRAVRTSDGAEAAAFFDLDKTLIDGDAGVLFGGHLLDLARIEVQQATGAKRRRLRRAYRLFYGEVIAKAAYVKLLSSARLMRRSSAVRTAYTFFRDQPVAQFEQALEAFFNEVLVDRVFPTVDQLIQKHHDAGHATVLITTGMQPIAERFAKLFGIEHVVACRLGRHGDRLTGRVEGPLWGADKAEEAERLAAQHGWDLDASYAYSDHHSDLALLEAVGHPRPVHPDKRLRRIAASRGWPIIDLTGQELPLAAHPERPA